MSVITITYEAKCKHCIHLKPYKFGQLKRSICTNPLSPRFDINPYLSKVSPKDKVCDKWQLQQPLKLPNE